MKRHERQYAQANTRPWRLRHVDFRRATRRVVDACRRHGKAAVLAVMDVDELCAGPSNGFRMLVYAADLWIYQQALRCGFHAIKGSLSPQSERAP